MKSEKKNNKVPKSAKTRLSDLTPKQDARGGKLAPAGQVQGAADPRRSSTTYKKRPVTL
jgi:hypothetical protein